MTATKPNPPPSCNLPAAPVAAGPGAVGVLLVTIVPLALGLGPALTAGRDEYEVVLPAMLVRGVYVLVQLVLEELELELLIVLTAAAALDDEDELAWRKTPALGVGEEEPPGAMPCGREKVVPEQQPVPWSMAVSQQ